MFTMEKLGKFHTRELEYVKNAREKVAKVFKDALNVMDRVVSYKWFK